jgi:hypothetical protein
MTLSSLNLRRRAPLLVAGLSLVMAAVFPGVTAAPAPKSQAQNTQRGVVVTQQPKPEITAGLAGHYYALVIGIDDYHFLPKLKTAVGDAKAVAAVLHDRYGFETTLLTDATRDQIVGTLNGYRQRLDDKSNLLIYYAGHGSYDKDADKTYWLPADARQNDTTNWIMADDITTAVKVIASRHVLIVADSCYSGGLTREVVPEFTPQERDRYIEKMVQGKSRTIMSSGGLEPVSDQGGGAHSVFAGALLKGLSDTSEQVFSAESLFERYIRVPVAGKSDQSPQYTPIRNSGHDFGDFVFVRANSAPNSQITVVKPGQVKSQNDAAPIVSAPSEERQPAAPALLAGPAPIVGCWMWFNHTETIIRTDGNAIDGAFVAQWQLMDAARQVYTIAWPKSVDTATLSADGMQLKGGSQYGYAMYGTRIGAPSASAVGTWRWTDGSAVTIESDGTIRATSDIGQWKLVDPARRVYNFIWPSPTDTLTLSADGLHLTGHNQYGVQTGGTKVAVVCPGMS